MICFTFDNVYSYSLTYNFPFCVNGISFYRFSWLPVTEDVDEAPYVYGFLADLIESNNPHVLGANNSNLPRVVAIIAEVLACEVLPPDDVAKQRLVNLVREVQVSIQNVMMLIFHFFELYRLLYGYTIALGRFKHSQFS